MLRFFDKTTTKIKVNCSGRGAPALHENWGCKLRPVESTRSSERRTRPVFVMGCHRSGTNLLYDTLLSAGGFAVYRGYLPVYKMLVPRLGSLARLRNRERAVRTWLSSKGFRRSGLNADQVAAKILDQCRNGGDFIRIVMDEIASAQDVARWAVYDPDNLLYIPQIKADIPEALFVHIMRDGRDVALSLSTMGGFKPFPWDRAGSGLVPTALYWEWMVRKGQEHGERIPADYMEVRYEDLVREPRAVLEKLGTFLDHDLNYDRIQKVGLGSLQKPNSSFLEEDAQPVNRWKQKLSREQVMAVESVIGEFLEELDYKTDGTRKPGMREQLARSFYFGLLDAKLWLKTRTPLGRLANLEALELSDTIERAE